MTTEIKVHKLNEYDWVAATTLDDAIAYYMKQTGLPRDEAVDDPVTLSDEAMEREQFWDYDGDLFDVKDARYSFRDALRRMLSGDRSKFPEPPFMFASTEI